MGTELKTLKDMNLFFSQRRKLEKEFYEYAEKDRLDNTVIADCPMNVIGWFHHKRDDQIRREAIKWINKRIKKHEELEGSGYGQQYFEEMMQFLNITEEDLK